MQACWSVISDQQWSLINSDHWSLLHHSHGGTFTPTRCHWLLISVGGAGSQEERWQLQIVAKGRVTCPKCKSVSRKTVEGLKKHMENCRLVGIGQATDMCTTTTTTTTITLSHPLSTSFVTRVTEGPLSFADASCRPSLKIHGLFSRVSGDALVTLWLLGAWRV